MIPYGKQGINQHDINAVIDVLKSDYLTQGPVVPLFEKAVSSFVGAKYGIAVNSGTSALHIACLSLGVSSGDIVWTTPISFVASANCALYCGAKIDFVDIDPLTGSICVEALSEKLINTSKNFLPKVIIVVHMAGNPCDMHAIFKLANPLDIKIIEDASHALGADYLDRKVGNCQFSSIATLSFHPIKMITTAEGGMALTNDKNLSDKMKLLASHGITKNKSKMEIKDPWCYEQKLLGFNYRMSDIHAALGLSQINRLNDFVSKRRSIAKNYQENLSSKKIVKIEQNKFGLSSFHLYMILVKDDLRKDMYEKLIAAGIGVQVHYMPIHLQPYFKHMNFKEGDFPNSEQYYNDVLTLPIYPELSAANINYIVETVNEY
mgnify:CR=1 FL=1